MLWGAGWYGAVSIGRGLHGGIHTTGRDHGVRAATATSVRSCGMCMLLGRIAVASAGAGSITGSNCRRGSDGNIGACVVIGCTDVRLGTGCTLVHCCRRGGIAASAHYSVYHHSGDLHRRRRRRLLAAPHAGHHD